MALTFPRDFPYDGAFSEASPFALFYQQSQSLTGGAIPNVVDLGPAYHKGQWKTAVNTREQFEVWHSWLVSMRGGLKTFKGRPARRKWPRMYPRGFAGLTVSASPFDGSGNLSAIGAQRDAITVNQLPVGFQLKIGDYCSITVGTRQHLHKIMEDATANGSGVVTLTVEPTIRPDATTSVDVLFAAPYCDMVLTAQSVTPDPSGRGGTISFEGQQVF